MDSASNVHASNMLATMPSLSLVSTVRLSSSAAPGGSGIGVSLGSTIDAGDADIERILCGSKDTTVFVDFYAE